MGRENTIEVLSLAHTVELPVDSHTGKIAAKRVHSGFGFEKELDSSTSYLYQALTTGKTFNKAIFNFYKINDAGQEVEYYRTTLENVKVLNLDKFFFNIKDQKRARFNHHEYVNLSFEKITWHYLAGNIIHSDSWQGRS